MTTPAKPEATRSTRSAADHPTPHAMGELDDAQRSAWRLPEDAYSGEVGGMSSIIVCSFSGGLDEMKRADQRDALKVLRVLVRDGRYSCFDASANQTIARTITNMHHKCLEYAGKRYGQLLKNDNTMGYPWSKVVLAEGGKQLLADYPEAA